MSISKHLLPLLIFAAAFGDIFKNDSTYKSENQMNMKKINKARKKNRNKARKKNRNK